MSISLLTLTMAAMSAVLPPNDILMTTDGLAKTPDALVVDARSQADFEKGHIPGAANLDVKSLSETRGGVQGLLRPVEQLKTLLEAAGIDPAKHIVVYGAMEEPESMTYPARMFWILEYLGFERVSLLDGGIGKWKEEGRPIETGKCKVTAITLSELKPRPELMATREQVMQFIQGKQGLLADMRPEEFYAGAKKKDYVAKAGHIPEAVDVPPAKVVSGPHNTFFAPEKLGEVFKGAGASSDKQVITYCNSGQSASLGYFALRRAGQKNVSVYDGSMAEWSANPECPVAVEKKP